MNKKLLFTLLSGILVLLVGCHFANKKQADDYQKTAFEALVKMITTEENEDVSTPESYVYQWSDEPATDILYLNTLNNDNKQLVCEQFYATDGFTAWRGGVIISTITGEIVESYSYHVFTSGVTPFMTLEGAFGEVGDTIDFGEKYERGLLKDDYGIFKITKVSDKPL